MEFGGDNYEDFFDKLRSHTGPRNLRQIFDDDEMPLQYESNTLRYQPQKPTHYQQTKQQTEAKSKSTATEKRQTATPAKATKGDRWTSIIAKVANGYNGTDKIGRVGVALTMNESETVAHGQYKLIVYKSKSQVLSTLLLRPKTKSPNVILRESYFQFYDDEQHFWSVRFESVADEQEFIKLMVTHGLPLEQMPSNVSKTSASANVTTSNIINTSTSRAKHNSTSTRENLEKLTTKPLLPQPQPRPRQPKPIESEEEMEDIIVTPVPQAIPSAELIPLNGRSSKKDTNLALTLATTTSPVKEEIISPNTADKLDIYLVEQRATGHVMEKKMDSILQVMSRLTATNAVGSSSFVGTGERGLDTLAKDDKEDELLELEQKLLNFKKENRALIKTLKAKEQALNDLRSSTCALCEELLAQNRELKQQNTALLAGMTQLRNQQVSTINTNNTTTTTLSSSSSSSTSPNCLQCDQSSAKILLLERRLSAMQNALNNGSHEVEGAPTH